MESDVDDEVALHSRSLRQLRTSIERRFVLEALERTDHDVRASARLLGISRQTLYNKLKRFGLKAVRPGARAPAQPSATRVACSACGEWSIPPARRLETER